MGENVSGGAGTTYYVIVNRNRGQGLDVNGGSTADGASQWPDNGGTNQQWEIIQQ
ncbi:RICIN domain-containing protein [Reichenbachiella ulvae]|uniref:RICIN domain-containing protein n=1 Tax=Reichenbachiella ulvae TaxID=2980104 RepID=A0ABT3CWE9_9BACT|nr:RICIN domain-containing protein [Reichenbachiella ulvae]MCV9387886.1 RICIN domain-containing protein [Reichenbachiella ulvae]